MARKDLQGRDNWQTESGPGGKAGVAEQNLIAVFKEAFKGTDTDMNNSIHALSSSFLLTYNAHFRKIHSPRYFPHRR